MFSKRIGLTIASFAAVGLAGCVTTHGTLANNAERLERSAVELQGDARDDGSSGYYRDAQEFAGLQAGDRGVPRRRARNAPRRRPRPPRSRRAR
jgi:hypothetical protein